MEFQFRDHVFLGVTLRRHVIRFGKKWELDPQYINLLEILQRVGEVAYKVTLPPQPQKHSWWFTYINTSEVWTTSFACKRSGGSSIKRKKNSLTNKSYLRVVDKNE